MPLAIVLGLLIFLLPSPMNKGTTSHYWILYLSAEQIFVTSVTPGVCYWWELPGAGMASSPGHFLCRGGWNVILSLHTPKEFLSRSRALPFLKVCTYRLNHLDPHSAVSICPTALAKEAEIQLTEMMRWLQILGSHSIVKFNRRPRSFGATLTNKIRVYASERPNRFEVWTSAVQQWGYVILNESPIAKFKNKFSASP